VTSTSIKGGGSETVFGTDLGARIVGGTLTVTDGRHAAAIALLGNYMAGSFVTAADGHGGTLLGRRRRKRRSSRC
jgi:hypothetical protein